MFSKVLIANRGEIAVRIIRACEELGIATVAVYSEIDRDALHVARADEAYLLGPAPASESYLKIDRIIEVCRESGAEAVHPGYGFLAENAVFARALEEAQITFIGPPSSAIDAMGSKTKARELMAQAGVPIVPGTTEPVESIDDARQIIAETIGYPVAVKAAGGGGGKGFRVALDDSKLTDAFEGAAREGEKFFGDATVYLERYLPDPRHVEVQVLADGHGNVIHLGERDCSLQRRHQKLIEESPAPAVDAALREKIGKIATDAAAAVDYTGAGTVEGLLQDGEYFFLEMNTRVQVEHCVTEMVTGIDIVKEGIRVAAGATLSIAQDEVQLRGHAIECRINAENAARNFAPAPGRIGDYREPAGPGTRVDSGVGPGSEISPMYDPMVAKLIVWDTDREQATKRMIRALGEYEITELTTLIPFHRAILATEQWANAETCRDLIEDRDWLTGLAVEPAGGRADADADADAEETVEQSYTVEVSGRRRPLRRRRPTARPPAAHRDVRSARARAGVAATRSPRRCRARCCASPWSRAPRCRRAR
jgi:acetyl-CoA/propionyl-CoA carboxylase biotin carboxyl carrier protein